MPNCRQIWDAVDAQLEELTKLAESMKPFPPPAPSTLAITADLQHKVRAQAAQIQELQKDITEYQACLEKHGVGDLADLDRQLQIANEFCSRTITVSREQDAAKGLSLIQRLRRGMLRG